MVLGEGVRNTASWLALVSHGDAIVIITYTPSDHQDTGELARIQVQYVELALILFGLI